MSSTMPSQQMQPLLGSDEQLTRNIVEQNSLQTVERSAGATADTTNGETRPEPPICMISLLISAFISLLTTLGLVLFQPPWARPSALWVLGFTCLGIFISIFLRRKDFIATSVNRKGNNGYENEKKTVGDFYDDDDATIILVGDFDDSSSDHEIIENGNYNR